MGIDLRVDQRVGQLAACETCMSIRCGACKLRAQPSVTCPVRMFVCDCKDARPAESGATLLFPSIITS